MKCGNCGNDNPDKAKFCMSCGQSMVRKCGSCDEELMEGAKFCMSCGTRVSDAPSAKPAPARDRLEQYIPQQLLHKLQAARQGGGMRGERRVVTMLFCDVQGSTAAAEQLDPEDWADIMNGAFEHLIAPVYRYEGTLARLMGDAILAFFGAPIAHEDDPIRAVLAALAIVQEIEPYARQVRRKWGIDFNVRVGINTGLVVVGEVGTDMRLEYTAMGDAVNLAARMESTAEPGTVQISEDTYKMVAPVFDTEELAPITVKGKAEPVQTYRVIRRKPKPGRLRGIEGLESPMVGRERELGALRGRIDAVRRGAGQIASVMGEAGLGKSRLVAELHKQLTEEGVDREIRWVEGRALSYQVATPYAPVVDMLRKIFEVPDQGSAEERYRSLLEQVEAIAGDEASRITPFVASRLGVPVEGEAGERIRYLDPPDLRRQTDAALVDLLDLLSERKPLVLVFEDLHWADPSTLEFLTELMKLTERAQVMLVAILRPRPQDASWKFHEVGARDFPHRYLSVALEPLTEEDSRALVANLLLIEGLPEQLRQLILKKSEGNPFYVEEVIRSLIDSGSVVRDGEHWKATREVKDIEVPGSLAAVLTTRLDQLQDQVKAVAQTASVIGRQFEFDVVASLHEPVQAVEDALSELQRRGIVRERSRRPVRLYSFKHVLTQEAAYGSLLLKTRREIHAKVADILSRLTPERSIDIARHFLEAREPDKALPHLVDGAEAAARAYATQEALAHFEQALEIVRSAEHADLKLARRMFEGRGNALQLVMDVPGAMENYREMQAFFETNRDLSAQASSLNKQGFIVGLFQGDLKAGEALLDQARDIAEEAACDSSLAEGGMIRCGIYTTLAEFDDAYRYLDQASALGDKLEAEEPMLYGRTHIANTMVLMTEFERAWPKIQEAVATAERLGNRKYLSELKTFALPVYQMNEGDPGALETLRQGIQMAEEIGAMASVANGASLLGRTLAYQGRFDESIDFNRRAVEAAKLTGMPFIMVVPYCNLGTSYLQVSEQLRPQALEAHDTALKTMELPLGTAFAAMAYCELGFCALDIGKPDRALELFEKGLTEKSAPILICKPHLHVGLSITCIQLGRIEEAAEHAREGRRFADERGIKMYAPGLMTADAHVAKAQGKRDEAIDRFEELEKTMESAGLLPAAWQAAHETSLLLKERGDEAGASAKRQRVAQIIDRILDNMEDPSIKKLYAEHARARAGL